MSRFKSADRRSARSLGTLPKHSSMRHYARSPHRGLYLAAIAAISCVMIFSASQLIIYAAEYASSKSVSDDLREIYYASETAEPSEAPLYTALPTTVPTSQPTTPPRTVQSSSVAVLPDKPYPSNPYAVVSDRFAQLRRQNIDIIGWLTIPGLIDEAVVQRDNSYYLRRDYRGYHNNNGALFLEETVDTSTRPYTLMIYGHNMHTGAMFGSLRNYENKGFFLDNPFLTFDTAWEKGRYVIFAVSVASTNALDKNYVNFAKLLSNTVPWREEAINQLIHASAFTNVIDVRADDQILLLVTCVDDDEERRVLCARRIREGETEESLRKQLTMMWSK